VVVFVSTYASTADLISSVTYGGVALTRLSGGLAIDTATEPGRLDTFFLGSGLGTGNQTITVNRTNNATVMYAAAATVTAAANTSVPTQTIVLLQDDGTLTVQSVDDTSPGVNSLRYAGAYSGLNTPPTAGTGSTLLNSIDIGNYGSALAVETTAGQGARNVGFTGATDDRAAVHLAIRELVPRTETPVVGSFTLTGNGATLTKASPKQMDGGRGAFTLTGNAAGLRHNTAITGERGAFTLTGNAAGLRHNTDIKAGVGAFTLTGNPADARHNVAITGNRGQFTLTGNDATLAKLSAKELLPIAGIFSLAGNQAGLAHGVRITGDRGAFTVSGQQAELARAVNLDGGRGQFLLTGNQAGLTRGFALAGDTGAFSLAGSPVTLAKAAADKLTPLVGAFTLSSQPATLTITRLLAGNRGQFTLTGQPAAPLHGWRVAGDRGNFLLTGNPATFAADRGLLGGTGEFTLTGNPVGLGDTDLLDATAGAFILTGLSAALAKASTTRRRNVLIF
jgi:hypothetical protein